MRQFGEPLLDGDEQDIEEDVDQGMGDDAIPVDCGDHQYAAESSWN